ncbi:hypothetical protein V8F06_008280 [Rhypophila decipiens]
MARNKKSNRADPLRANTKNSRVSKHYLTGTPNTGPPSPFRPGTIGSCVSLMIQRIRIHCECECHEEKEEKEEDDSDVESEKSYTGSGAKSYYELKEQREDRKRELLSNKRMALATEDRREKEILEAIAAIQEKDDSVNNNTEVGSSSSSMAAQSFSASTTTTTTISNGEKSEPSSRMVHGHLILTSDTICELEPFRLGPTNQSPRTITVKAKPKPTERYEKRPEFRHDDDLTFRFIGNDYVELELTREYIFALEEYRGVDLKEVDIDAHSEVFKFVGVKFDVEEEKAELAAKREAKRAYWDRHDARSFF